jgi:hypothetical protein
LSNADDEGAGGDSTVENGTAAAVPQLTRAEAALCMLPDIAYQHGSASLGHLAPLLHVCVIKIDAANATVSEAAHRVRSHIQHCCTRLCMLSACTR